MKKVLALLLSLLMLLSLVACGNSEEKIIGEWYNAEEDDYLIVQSDNTYKIKHHPGAMGYDIGSDYGTWRWLEEEEAFKFIDANGDTHEVVIEKDQETEKIKYYYYGYFTKQ